MATPEFRCGLAGPGRIAHRLAEAAQRLPAPSSRCAGATTRAPRPWRSAARRRAGAEVESVERPFQIDGFEGEVTAAMRCIRGGQAASARMPHAERPALVRTMDEMRRQVGVRCPFGRAAA